MPRYAYKCLDCHYDWEEDLPVILRDAPTELACPECEGFNIRRAVGCRGFQLRGFCWARDNYSRTVGDDPVMQERLKGT